MRAIVIAGGDIGEPNFYKRYFDHCDLVVCADSGYLNCKAIGITPHLVIGDFDSCDADCVPPEIPVTRLPVEKDETDLHTCINYAIRQGATEVLLFGARGSRLDHSLAAISLVYMGLSKGVVLRLIDERNELLMFTDSVKIPKRSGYKLSLLPLVPVAGICTKGLYYGLNGASMDWGNPYGVSNEFTADMAEISIESGVMMVILSRD